MSGTERFHKLLRIAVASELYLEANFYANHPHFRSILQNHTTTFKSKAEIGVMSFSFKASGDDSDFLEFEEIVRREAKVCLELFSWSSLVCILAIPNILQVNRLILKFREGSDPPFWVSPFFLIPLFNKKF